MTYGGLVENEDEFLYDLALLHQLYAKYTSQNFKVIIVGDFNTDISRQDKHSHNLNQFLENNSLKLIDTEIHQQIAYTHQRKHHDRSIKSWIDHVCVDPIKIEIGKVEIFESKDNFSDHNPIRFSINTNAHKEIELNEEKKAQTPNWLNPVFQAIYSDRFEKSLKSLDHKITDMTNEKDLFTLKVKITALLNDISSIAISATNKTLSEINSFNLKKKHVKKKSWWCETMQYLHNVVKQNIFNINNQIIAPILNQNFMKQKKHSVLENDSI